tara:strand:+ start:134 stop:2035 length:1902 start_codon:yes stop_codon:yes gene_type:complete
MANETSTPPKKSIKQLVSEGFDAAWYEKTYSAEYKKFCNDAESALEFYFRMGGRLGHDPHQGFSEILYRKQNIDVRTAMVQNTNLTSYRHWLQFGIAESNRILINKRQIDLTREIYLALDRDFLQKTYGIRAAGYPDIVDYYFAHVVTEELSPRATFSEMGYCARHPDVENAIKEKLIPSGFAHYLITQNRESRAIVSHRQHLEDVETQLIEKRQEATKLALEHNIPGVTALAAMSMLDSITFYDGNITVNRTVPQGPGGLFVLVPNFLPEILFGGYLAFFGYLRRLAEETGIGLQLMLVSRASLEQYEGNLMRMSIKEPKVYEMFESIHKFDPKKRTIDIPENYHVISYCGELHRISSKIAKTANQKPIFFIQEHEAEFHANTDMRSFNDTAFLLPHHAVYNSRKLIEFFQKKTDVFNRAGPDYKYTAIENALERLKLSKEQFIKLNKVRNTRRFIMYGRPEGHAARNHFGMSVYALRKAIEQGVFAGGDWEFISIGALGQIDDIALTGPHKLRIMPKISKHEYEEFLQTGDVGMSLITTPHPGIVHFQMAAYGLPTITNKTELRDEAWLSAQNRNLVAVEMSPEAIVDGFRIAVERARDLDVRYDNAIESPIQDEESCLRQALDDLAAIIT